MNPIFDYLIATSALIAISALCSFMGKRQFSLKLFLTAFNIGTCILMWQRLYPTWMIVIVILIITAMLFAGTVEEKTGVSMPGDLAKTGDIAEKP